MKKSENPYRFLADFQMMQFFVNIGPTNVRHLFDHLLCRDSGRDFGHFLRVGSRLSELHVIILPGTQIFKEGSQISDCSRFRFSFLKFYVAPSRITQLGATRNKKKTQSRENESRFHYLCFYVYHMLKFIFCVISAICRQNLPKSGKN